MRSETKRLKDKAWKLFSRYIRRKHSDQDGLARCYTCGVVKPYKELQCGHGIGGRGNYILFKEEVCRPQCYSCNVGKDGNYQRFVPKLVKQYSLFQYEQWEIDSRQVVKRNKQYYVDLIDELQSQHDEFDDMGML